MQPARHQLSNRARSCLLAAYSCLLCLSGCSFGDDDDSADEINQNSCSADADCGKQQRCLASRCVAFSTDMPRSVALVVTPKSMPDGSLPQPIVSKPFPLSAGNQSFELALPLSIPVYIHAGSTPIAAQVSFSVAKRDAFSARPTQISTVAPASAPTNGESDNADRPLPTNTATLIADTDYTVVVQPSDAKLPAHTLTFNAYSGATLDIDYDDIKWEDRAIKVRNLPCGANYNVRARAKGGGALISNSVALDALLNPRITLSFDPGALESPYDLEFAPSNSSASSTALVDLLCTTLSPAPTISVPSHLLKADTSDRRYLSVDFPPLPDAIEYAGQITLCDNQVFTDNLSVSVKATSLSLGENSGVVTGRYETTTTAYWNEQTKSYGFSLQVFPGEYTVVVTPPANLSCEMFAQRRVLKLASGHDALEPDTLELRPPATLSGRVLSPDMTPIANASIDLVALGTTAVTLAVNDRTVPLYNRSRQGTTASTGMFTLPVDVGSYDLIVKPPAQTNYAWRILYGIDVGSRTPTFTTLVYLTAPVVVTGRLSYIGGGAREQSSLAAAEVRAYTVVDDTMNERSVEIARGQADANGNLSLLLPPQLQKSWIPE